VTKLELRDGVAHVSIDDGKVNAMSAELLDAYAATKARVNERVLAAVRAAIAEELA